MVAILKRIVSGLTRLLSCDMHHAISLLDVVLGFHAVVAISDTFSHNSFVMQNSLLHASTNLIC